MLERTWVSELSLYISTLSEGSGDGDGVGEGDGDGVGEGDGDGVGEGGKDGVGEGRGKGGGNQGMSGFDDCTMIPEVLTVSVDWRIPTTEALPMSNKHKVKTETAMWDLLSTMEFSSLRKK